MTTGTIPSPQTKAARRQRWIITMIVIFVVLAVFDRAVVRTIFDPDEPYTRGDFHDLLWQFGRLPIWILVGLAAALARSISPGDLFRDGRAALAKGLDVPLVCAVSGLAAEIVKRIVGRERPFIPETIDPMTLSQVGEARFKPFLSAFLDDHNLGFPSSHTAVAFAAAFYLMLRWPRVAPIAFLMAAGCAFQRIISSAHFLTDVFGGLVIAMLVALWLDRVLPRPACCKISRGSA